MHTSEVVKAVDWVQREMRPHLKERGFRVRGRTFNRVTSDGLVQVVNIQTGSADPPGTTYIPGLRENLYGLFTVNLGVYIPEVAELRGEQAKSWVQDYHCAIRERLGPVSGEARDVWWHARQDAAVADDVSSSLVKFGLPFLDRFATRDLVLAELDDATKNLPYCSVPRIVNAIILSGRNEPVRARDLLAEQTHETWSPGHPAYVRKLAIRMGLGEI
jgi:hypothetical protein